MSVEELGSGSRFFGGSKAPSARSKHWGGRSLPVQETFPRSLSAVQRPASGTRREGGQHLLLPQEETTLSHQRSSGAADSDALGGLPRAGRETGPGNRARPRAKGQVQRKKIRDGGLGRRGKGG